MTRKGATRLGYVFLGWAMVLYQALPVCAQQVRGRPEVFPLVFHDVSRPLREIPPVLAVEGQRVIPLRPVPHGPSVVQTDAALQTTIGPLVGTTTPMGFEGLGQGQYGFTVTAAPPDTNLAVGATQAVQWVNLSFAIFDKATNALIYGPAAGNTIWQGSTLSACANNNDGDPIVQYDKAAGRWVMTQLSFTGAPPYYECIAISQTSDATGPWNRYALQWVNNTLPDYPKLAVWPDAYYMTFNIFFGGFLFIGGQACALDRSKMLLNLDATAQCFQLSSSYPSLLPSDLDGATAPPAGSPNFLLNLGSNSLNLWQFHVDWANPGNTTLTGPTNVSVATFNQACGGGTCIPQPGTSQQLDSIGERLMYRLAYRNFGDHESLVANHSVAVGSGKRNKGNTGVRWYELRNPAGTPVVFQQGTYAPDSDFRWMGSIAMDKAGDIAVGYSVSSSVTYPSIRFTGRVPGDVLGTLEAEASIADGHGSQLPNLSRWGDYSSMSIDPGDDCTFWYTTEYLQSSGKFNWNTRIAKFKFPGCI